MPDRFPSDGARWELTTIPPVGGCASCALCAMHWSLHKCTTQDASSSFWSLLCNEMVCTSCAKYSLWFNASNACMHLQLTPPCAKSLFQCSMIWWWQCSKCSEIVYRNSCIVQYNMCNTGLAHCALCTRTVQTTLCDSMHAMLSNAASAKSPFQCSMIWRWLVIYDPLKAPLCCISLHTNSYQSILTHSHDIISSCFKVIKIKF